MSPRDGARLRPPDPRWVDPREPDPTRVEALVRELKLPRALCAVLVGRGFDDGEVAKRFLRPRLDHLSDPSLLADGPRAAKRIADAVKAGERIFVHGDYDVDGICATALLTRWLRSRGADVVPFVPHRVRDGYDFGPAGLAAAIDAGASLVVTADCGTVAHDTIDDATRARIDVVVTDHHTVGASLPSALAVVNPKRPDCAYPDDGLCGAGITFRLAQLVASELGGGGEDLLDLLDLVALATIADLVPLRGENRVLAHFGLRRFARSRVPGVRALLAAAGVDPASVRSGQIGYQIAPRINAAGRVGEAADALRLLLTDDPGEAERLAGLLDAQNAARREEDRRTLDEALTRLEETYDPDRDYGVVLAGRGWHPGVIGIVASRVVERIHRPVVMVALDGERARGSARSIPGFHLYEAISSCSAHLERFGGHEQAAGMDVAPDAIEAFRTAFNEAARERLSGADLRPTLRPDLDVDLTEIDLDLARWLGYLGPHGIGNPGPLFRAERVVLEGARTVGGGHLKARLRRQDGSLDAIGFGLAERFPPETLVGSADVLFRLERNEWRGRVRAQAKVVDLRPRDDA